MSLKLGDFVVYRGRTDPGYNEESGIAKIVSTAADENGCYKIEIALTKKIYTAHESRLTLSTLLQDGRGSRKRMSRSPSDSIFSPGASSVRTRSPHSSTSSNSSGTAGSKKKSPQSVELVKIESVRRVPLGTDSKKPEVEKDKLSVSGGAVKREGGSLLDPYRGVSSISSSASPGKRQKKDKRRSESFTGTNLLFNDVANDIVYPKIGNEVKVIYDGKDWLSGIVNSICPETNELTIYFEDGAIETLAFPCPDLILLDSKTNFTQRNGGRPIDPPSEYNCDILIDQMDPELLLGSQFGEVFPLGLSGREREFWGTVSKLLPAQDKNLISFEITWDDKHVTYKTLTQLVASLNANRVSQRAGRNGSIITNESGRPVRASRLVAVGRSSSSGSSSGASAVSSSQSKAVFDVKKVKQETKAVAASKAHTAVVLKRKYNKSAVAEKKRRTSSSSDSTASHNDFVSPESIDKENKYMHLHSAYPDDEEGEDEEDEDEEGSSDSDWEPSLGRRKQSAKKRKSLSSSQHKLKKQVPSADSGDTVITDTKQRKKPLQAHSNPRSTQNIQKGATNKKSLSATGTAAAAARVVKKEKKKVPIISSIIKTEKECKAYSYSPQFKAINYMDSPPSRCDSSPETSNQSRSHSYTYHCAAPMGAIFGMSYDVSGSAAATAAPPAAAPGWLGASAEAGPSSPFPTLRRGLSSFILHSPPPTPQPQKNVASSLVALSDPYHERDRAFAKVSQRVRDSLRGGNHNHAHMHSDKTIHFPKIQAGEVMGSLASLPEPDAPLVLSLASHVTTMLPAHLEWGLPSALLSTLNIHFSGKASEQGTVHRMAPDAMVTQLLRAAIKPDSNEVLVSAQILLDRVHVQMMKCPHQWALLKRPWIPRVSFIYNALTSLKSGMKRRIPKSAKRSAHAFSSPDGSQTKPEDGVSAPAKAEYVHDIQGAAIALQFLNSVFADDMKRCGNEVTDTLLSHTLAFDAVNARDVAQELFRQVLRLLRLHLALHMANNQPPSSRTGTMENDEEEPSSAREDRKVKSEMAEKKALQAIMGIINSLAELLLRTQRVGTTTASARSTALSAAAATSSSEALVKDRGGKKKAVKIKSEYPSDIIQEELDYSDVNTWLRLLVNASGATSHEVTCLAWMLPVGALRTFLLSCAVHKSDDESTKKEQRASATGAGAAAVGVVQVSSRGGLVAVTNSPSAAGVGLCDEALAEGETMLAVAALAADVARLVVSSSSDTPHASHVLETPHEGQALLREIIREDVASISRSSADQSFQPLLRLINFLAN